MSQTVAMWLARGVSDRRVLFNPSCTYSETDLLRRIDDEDGTYGEDDFGTVDVSLIDHAILEGDAAIGVGNYRELEIGVVEFVDVVDPAAVRVEIVGALYSNQYDSGRSMPYSCFGRLATRNFAQPRR